MTTAFQPVSHQLRQDEAEDFKPFNVIITARNAWSPLSSVDRSAA